MSATSLDLSQIKTDALSAASTFRTLIGLGSLATQSGTFSGTSSGTNTGDQDLSGLLVKASNLSDVTNAATARTNLGLGTGNTPTFLALALSGQSLTGSQATSLIDASATWNTTGTPTAFKLNVTDTASNASSRLMDLQVDGVSRLSVRAKSSYTRLETATGGIIFGPWTGEIWFGGVGGAGMRNSSQLALASTAEISWTNTVNNFYSANQDLFILRDAAQTLAQRNAGNAQTFRIYESFTDASNYTRGKLEWASNVLRIGTEKAGTGSARALELQTDGTTRLTIGTTGISTFSSAVKVTTFPDRFTELFGWTDNLGFAGLTGWAGQNRLYLSTQGIPVFGIESQGRVAVVNALLIGASMSNFVGGVTLVAETNEVLAQRNGTAAQRFNLYGTFTNSSNYERMFLEYNTTGTAYRVGTEKAGTGSARALELQTDGTTRMSISSAGAVTIGAFTLPTTDGSNGQVLQTNGSGTVTWQSAQKTITSGTAAPTGGADGDIYLQYV